ncbi:MAG: chorismate synthase [Bacillota bacterium]
MNSTWGNNFKLSIFGESHGKGIGIVLDGIPAGISLDLDAIKLELKRRAPGRGKLTSSRKETDSFEILSGYFNGKTSGSPLTIIIYNNDVDSSSYESNKNLLRPGHADYTGYMKHSGYNDYRGGGHFSGRLTAPLVIAGAVAKQLLIKHNISIGSHIYGIGHIRDAGFDPVNIDSGLLEQLHSSNFPTIDFHSGKAMQELIEQVSKEGDSIGGIVEAAIVNLPAGLGSPFFDSFESLLSHLLFSIPAIKGIEFGAGFNISNMKGSQSNDEFYINGSKISTYTNKCGGILGGITNGMPVVFRAAFKPTPSIAVKQNTVDIREMKDAVISVSGRHDPCIVPRALPVVEAAAALAVLDMLMNERKYFIWD